MWAIRTDCPWLEVRRYEPLVRIYVHLRVTYETLQAAIVKSNLVEPGGPAYRTLARMRSTLATIGGALLLPRKWRLPRVPPCYN